MGGAPVTDTEAIKLVANQTSRELAGRRLKDDEMQSIIDQVHADEQWETAAKMNATDESAPIENVDVEARIIKMVKEKTGVENTAHQVLEAFGSLAGLISSKNTALFGLPETSTRYG